MLSTPLSVGLAKARAISEFDNPINLLSAFKSLATSNFQLDILVFITSVD